METLKNDLKFGLRMLARRPSVTFTILVCLAVGIGASTVVFSLVRGVLLQPLPYEAPERVVYLSEEFTAQGITGGGFSSLETIDIRERQKSFEAVEGMVPWYFNLTRGDEPRRLVGGRISPGMLPMLGVTPALGRNFVEEEAQGARVALISHRLWQTSLGSDPDIVGKDVYLDENAFEVVGVMPPDFFFVIETIDVWVPWSPNPNFPRNARLVRLGARLSDGVTLDQARSDLDSIAAGLATDHPDFYPPGSGFGFEAQPIHQLVTGDVRAQLLTLLGAVLLVLLIACSSVANVLLVLGWQREREMGIRAAIGAPRGVLVRQLLTEGLLLAVLGGAGGLLLSYWGVARVRTLDLQLPRLESITIDGSVLLFSLGVSVLTGLVFSLVPALKASGGNLFSSLREGLRTTDTSGRQFLRKMLVVGEIALAVVVMVGAGLMMRAFHKFEAADPGFHADDLVTFNLFLPGAKYRGPQPMIAFYRDFRQQVVDRAEIEVAGLVNCLPLSPLDLEEEVAVEGRHETPTESDLAASIRMVSPGYFETLEIPTMRGEVITDLHTLTSEPVAVLDATLAQRIWPDGTNPIDQRIQIDGDPAATWRRVIGVVGSIRDEALVGEDKQLLYLPFEQWPYPVVGLAVRSKVDTPATIEVVREALAQVDPYQPVANIKDGAALLANAKAKPRINRLLFTLFGMAVVLLVAVGIYGVLAFAVTQRTRELGLRMALGSDRGSILQMIVRQGVGMAAVGLALGLVLVAVLSMPLRDFMADLLYGVPLFDPTTLVGVLFLVGLVALAASLVPALRATRIDPLEALREE